MIDWDLSQFDGKDVIFTGENRDMTAMAAFLKKHGHAKSLQHIFVDLEKPAMAYEQFGKPDLRQTVLVKTAGVPGSKMGAPYVTSTQLFFELLQPKGNLTIGVTGSKGKTTTASLIAAMITTAGKDVTLCGNIGKPMINYLDEMKSETIFVIELSSYQLEDLRQSPHIACITNLYTDHLDYHGSLEKYFAAKYHIIEHQTANDIYIYNPDFPMLADWAKDTKAKAVPIDTNESLDMSHSKLIGDHNRLNAIIAKTAAMQAGASEQDCLKVLEGFEPIEHRLQPVATVNGVTYIDDAIASLPEAAIAALKAVSQSVCPVGVALLGGQDRGYDFKPLTQELADKKVGYLVLFPDTVAKMKAALPASYQPEILETSDMHEAVQWATKHAPQGSAVLLSTGAPSYSLWKDFEDKGNQFQTAVRRLS